MTKIYVLFFLYLSFLFLQCGERVRNKKQQIQRKLENYAVINTSDYFFDTNKILIQYEGGDPPVPWDTTVNGYDAVARDKQRDNQSNFKKISYFSIINKNSDTIKITSTKPIRIEVKNDTILTFQLFKDSGGVYLLYICNDKPGTSIKSVIINSSNKEFEISSVKYEDNNEPQTLPDSTQTLYKNRITTIRLHLSDDDTRTTGRSVEKHIIEYDPLEYEYNNIEEIDCKRDKNIKYAVGVEMSNSQKENE